MLCWRLKWEKGQAMKNLLDGGFVVDWRIQSESGERVTMKWQLEEVTMGEKTKVLVMLREARRLEEGERWSSRNQAVGVDKSRSRMPCRVPTLSLSPSTPAPFPNRHQCSHTNHPPIDTRPAGPGPLFPHHSTRQASARPPVRTSRCHSETLHLAAPPNSAPDQRLPQIAMCACLVDQTCHIHPPQGMLGEASLQHSFRHDCSRA